MEPKTIRFLVYFFLAVIAVFVFFIIINALGNRGASAPRQSASTLAKSFMTMADFSSSSKAEARTAPDQVLSSASLRGQSSISIVRNRAFEGVAEPPETSMDILNDMSGSNNPRIAPIPLEAADLEKKISMRQQSPQGPALAGARVPGIDEPLEAATAVVKAPVDYKLFTGPENWAAFANSHKCGLLKPDFSREAVLILVSVSDFPSGIFKIAGVENSGKEIVVRYRVDPLAMSSSSDPAEQQAFSAAVVSNSGAPVRLEQVP